MDQRDWKQPQKEPFITRPQAIEVSTLSSRTVWMRRSSKKRLKSQNQSAILISAVLPTMRESHHVSSADSGKTLLPETQWDG